MIMNNTSELLKSRQLTTSFQQNNFSMAVSKGLQILLVTLRFGVLASALDICAFNIQVFGVSKMEKPHVVEKLVDVSVNYLKFDVTI